MLEALLYICIGFLMGLGMASILAASYQDDEVQDDKHNKF